MNITQDLKQTLSYLQNEIQRIETMAGTLAAVENEHSTRLNRFEHRELNDMAVEEKNAARQLQTIKHMCLSMVQKMDEMQTESESPLPEERTGHAEIH